VHSAKDVPADLPPELRIVGVPARESAADAYVGGASSLDAVAQGARIGTASLRRRAQLLARRPDLDVVELHGNVDTRLSRLRDGDLDGIVLAAAGLRRLGREGEIAFLLAGEEMVGAAGQGALALEARSEDEWAAAAGAKLSDHAALVEVTAERTVTVGLEATCDTPVGVNAVMDGGHLEISAFVGLPDGSEWIRDAVEGDAEDPLALAETLVGRLHSVGAAELLERAAAEVAR
jgi:hydroxymethylbilane synthase